MTTTFNEADINRRSNGEFGELVHSEPEVGIVRAWSPGEAVTASVHKEQWTADDFIQEIEVVDLDVRAILDTYALDDLPADTDSSDADFIFDNARTHGLIDHDGPFTVRLPEDVYPAYIAARQQLGQEDLIARTFVPSEAQAYSFLEDVKREEEALRVRREQAIENVVTAEAAARFPKASSVRFDLSGYSPNAVTQFDAHGNELEHTPAEANMLATVSAATGLKWGDDLSLNIRLR